MKVRNRLEESKSVNLVLDGLEEDRSSHSSMDGLEEDRSSHSGAGLGYWKTGPFKLILG
jgi:hypothetical protein